MKNITTTRLFCLLAGMFITAPAFAQSEPPPLGQALDTYGNIYTAWRVNKECDFLGKKERKRFKKDLQVIQSAMPNDPKVKKLRAMSEDTAKNTARNTECNDESEAAVRQMVELADDWSDGLKTGWGAEDD